MRVRLFPLAFLCLICAFAAAGQTIDETKSTASISSDGIVVNLSAHNRGRAGEVPATIELLDISGTVVSRVSQIVAIGRGRNSLQFTLPADKIDKTDDMVWYRLRYFVGSSAGTISFSQMVADVFEMRIASSSGVMAGMKYVVRVSSVNPFTRMPIGGVNISAKLSLDLKSGDDDSLELRAEGVTDSGGQAMLVFNIPSDAELDDDGEIEITGRRNGIVREATEDLDSVISRSQFLMFTDKALYQPEQTINLRGIFLKGVESYTVAPGREVDIRIEDEEETVVYRQKLQTSEFGIASTAWNIPPNAKLGRYTIIVRDEYGEQIGYQNLKVSRYDLPNFAVRTDPDKPYYLPADSVAELVIRADYLFGKPVTKGKVRVVEEKDRQWNWREQKYDIDEGQVFEGETDADGKFTARYVLADGFAKLKDRGRSKYNDVNFAAYFTDPTTNRTEQRRFDIRLTSEPIHVYFTVADGNPHSSLPVVGYVTAFYADGTPAVCEIEIHGSDDEDEGFRTINRTRTNSLGVAKAEFRLQKADEFDEGIYLRIAAKDGKGKIGTENRRVEFDDEDDDAIRVSAARSILKPGEPIEVEILSTKQSGTSRVDIVRGWTVLTGFDVALRNGRGRLTVPYDPQFEGEIKIAAYIEPETEDDEIVRSVRQVIYPVRQNLNVEANFGKAIYKPGEDAKLTFGVTDAAGGPAESALGVAIIDTAVEHRARTDTEFGSMMSNYLGWLGYGNNIGRVNIKDIRDLDLTKPTSAEMQLVAEALLADARYRPSVFFSDNLLADAKYAFIKHYKPQAEMVTNALRSVFDATGGEFPADDASLVKILRTKNIEFALVRDPWGIRYRTQFGVEKENAFVRLMSNGPDKRPETADDFEIEKINFKYFTPTGRKIDDAVKNFHERTGGFIRDRETLLRELGVDEISDVYGRAYAVEFGAERRNYTMTIRSFGRDGKRDQYSWRGDDFTVWTNRIDYFDSIEQKIAAAQREVKKIPMTIEEFKESLLSAGIDLDALRDGHGRPLYVVASQYSRPWNRVTTERVRQYGVEGFVDKQTFTPVTQEVISFTIRSVGEDGKEGTWRDFTLTQVIHVLSERSKDDEKPIVKNASFTISPGNANTGSIDGTITDPTGAAIPGATVTATNDATGQTNSVTSSASGRYLIVGLSAGKYTLTVESPGFSRTVVNNIPVSSGITTNLPITLDIGGISEVVSVSAGAESVVNATNASIVTTVTQQQIASLPLNTRDPLALLQLQPGAAAAQDDQLSTPRLRQYFPETLLWNPQLITGLNGLAELNFKMADNITTWKVYTIASTRDGKVGVAEKEVTAFQSFFADLDPPRYLTEGDEISLPVQIRNYTEARQKVGVTMDTADWFSFLASDRGDIEVPSGATENAIFGFRATRPIKDGKQRVTAIASSESDAIEKPVTVRPDGEEIVRTESKYFTGSGTFAADFPANALPGTPRAEVKIYPNLFAHITESVEGMLQRPYGCGEQTISSTYPNLMIVKFVKEDTPLRRKGLRNLVRGMERLIGYQAANGGFTYWGGRSEPDLALTAYALRFLRDAGGHIAFDQSVVERAEKWLISQQQPDGSWNIKYAWETSNNESRAKMMTTYVARSLAMQARMDNGDDETNVPQSAAMIASLKKAIAYLHGRNAEIEDPYTLSLLGLVSLDTNNASGAEAIAERLIGLAKDEAGAAYWNLEMNTPFGGWGRTGRVETTALAAQFLARLQGDDAERSELLSRAMLFLFRNKDRYGVWYSTQTTVNVLDTFLAVMAKTEMPDRSKISVRLNGEEVSKQTVPGDQLEPVIVDVTGKLTAGQNVVEIAGQAGIPLMANVVAGHYIDWNDSVSASRNVNDSRAVELDVKCDKTTAAIMDEITCAVRAERVGFQGYGMLLAEIGTPPGADVSREAMKEAMEADRSISRYDILPDRVVVYMWARAGGTKFNLKFRPRYGINAQTPASIVYDYYNPEAQAIVPPVQFVVR